MSSFYEKLSQKLGSEGQPPAVPNAQAPAGSSKSVTYSATGDRTSAPAKKDDASTQEPAAERAPEGTDPIDVDLFQSDSRMVIFMQLSGVPSGTFDITMSEESNTLMIEATQKRPDLPPLEGVKAGDPPEKGIYAKQEIKWKGLYRKIYLPAAFDSSSATAVLQNGVLMITLPAKHPGAGKKLMVKEVRQDENKK